MFKIQIEYNAANGVAIDVANDVLPFWWIEVYLFRFNQLKLLSHAENLMILRYFKFIKCHFIRIALRRRRYMFILRTSSNLCRSVSGAR